VPPPKALTRKQPAAAVDHVIRERQTAKILREPAPCASPADHALCCAGSHLLWTQYRPALQSVDEQPVDWRDHPLPARPVIQGILIGLAVVKTVVMLKIKTLKV
jgi:hypothetical protein